MNPWRSAVDTKLVCEFYSWGIRIKVVDLLYVFSYVSCLICKLYISYDCKTPFVYVDYPIDIVRWFKSWPLDVESSLKTMCLFKIINRLTTSVDSDEIAHYEQLHLDLHYLHRHLYRSTWLKWL